MSSKPSANHYALAQCGIEMVAPMIPGIFIDNWLNTTPVFISILGIIGFIVGLRHMVMLAKKIDDEEKDAKKKAVIEKMIAEAKRMEIS